MKLIAALCLVGVFTTANGSEQQVSTQHPIKQAHNVEETDSSHAAKTTPSLPAILYSENGQSTPNRITINKSLKITMIQNDINVALQIELPDQIFEPEVNINLDEKDGNILFIKVSHIHQVYKLPSKVKWPVSWVYFYYSSVVALVLERVEPVSDKDYWKDLDELSERSNDQRVTYEKQLNGYEYQTKVDTWKLLVDSPFVYYENFQFVPDHGSHAYANYPFGTCYTFTIPGTDGKTYEHTFFPIPRELLDARVNNKETLQMVRREVVSTDEKQRLYVGNGILEDDKKTGLYDTLLNKFKRQTVTFSNNQSTVTMKKAILTASDDKIIFFAVGNGVTTFLDVFLNLCSYTSRHMILFYLNSDKMFSFFEDEFTKLTTICNGRLELHRIHPQKEGITEEDEKKRFPDGSINLSEIKELTTSLTQCKGSEAKPKNAVFISAPLKNITDYITFLKTHYEFSEENIYYFITDPLPVEVKQNSQ